MTFECIQNIDISTKASWENKIFLTIDVEWACDEVLAYVIEILNKADIKATFFCTHQTPLLDKIRKNSNFELGIHPNFNPLLLEGDFRYGKNAKQVIAYYKNIVPEAKSVRSHCLTQNSHLSNYFSQHNITFESNSFIQLGHATPLSPYRHFINSNLISVPLFWEDDVHCAYQWKFNVKAFLKTPGLKVFNFHPNYIFLNAENTLRYESTKPYYKNAIKLEQSRNNKFFGTYNFLMDLIETVK